VTQITSAKRELNGFKEEQDQLREDVDSLESVMQKELAKQFRGDVNWMCMQTGADGQKQLYIYVVHRKGGLSKGTPEIGPLLCGKYKTF